MQTVMVAQFISHALFFTWTFSENMGRIVKDSQRSLFNTESLCLLPAFLTQLLSIHSPDPLLCLSVSCKPFLCVFLSANFNSFSFQALTNSWAPIHVDVYVIWLRSPQWANDQPFLLSFWENPSLLSFSQKKHCPRSHTLFHLVLEPSADVFKSQAWVPSFYHQFVREHHQSIIDSWESSDKGQIHIWPFSCVGTINSEYSHTQAQTGFNKMCWPTIALPKMFVSNDAVFSYCWVPRGWETPLQVEGYFFCRRHDTVAPPAAEPLNLSTS